MMRSKRKICIVLAMVFALMFSTVGCGSTGGGKGTIRIGVRDDIMNFGYLNEDTGKYYGMEIDLANELADRLGYKEVEFITVQPENRKQMLLDGEVDCLIATYSIADTRLKNFDFSAPYYVDQIKVMVEKSSMIKDVDDLKGQSVGVLDGANAAPLLAIKLNELGMIPEEPISDTETSTVYDGIELTKSLSYDELDVMLEDGRIDAYCTDSCIANTYMNDDREFLDLVVSEPEYGVATQKDSKLSKPVADAIDEMLEDGTINELVDKWN